MCGIAGIYNAEGIIAPPDVILEMGKTLYHRGPDGNGFYLDHYAHLASTRLSVIDLAGGNQPMVLGMNRLVVVFNGEIYNFKEIRQELRGLGHRFRTDSDTEVILRAYEQWSERSLSKLRGMFAFAVWDKKKNELFLARDRLGVKPLYYAHMPDGTFLFGSEIKTLLRFGGLQREMNPKALDHLLTFSFSLAPHTFFKGIRQVLPGHFMKVSAAGRTDTEYWDIDMNRPVDGGGEDELIERFLDKFKTAVNYRLISDVPVAAYLSGGIDSSSVAAVYQEMAEDPIQTFSITFDGADYDESAYSRMVAGHLGTRNVEFKCQITPESVSDLIYFLEEPMVTLLNLPLFMLSKTVRDSGFKVVLSGDGADEVMGGYDYFKLLKIMEFVRKHETDFRKNMLRRILPGVQTPVQASLQYLLMKDTPAIHPALPYRYRQFPYRQEIYSDDFRQRLKEASPVEPLFFDVEKIAHRPLMEQALYLESKMRLLNLTLPLADKMSMAHSVELRSPFLDHELVEFLFQIPMQMKLKGLEEKYILKQSMRSRLPEAICRRKKQPLQPPENGFIKANREMFREYLSDEAVRNRGYFNPGFISRSWDFYENRGRADFASVIIVAFFVHLWDELFLNSPNPSQAISSREPMHETVPQLISA